MRITLSIAAVVIALLGTALVGITIMTRSAYGGQCQLVCYPPPPGCPMCPTRCTQTCF